MHQFARITELVDLNIMYIVRGIMAIKLINMVQPLVVQISQLDIIIRMLLLYVQW
eukprot:UN08655